MISGMSIESFSGEKYCLVGCRSTTCPQRVDGWKVKVLDLGVSESGVPWAKLKILREKSEV